MTEAAFNAAELDFGIIRQQRTVEVEFPADIVDRPPPRPARCPDLESRLKSAHGESFELPLSLDDLAAICTVLFGATGTGGRRRRIKRRSPREWAKRSTSVPSGFLMEIAAGCRPQGEIVGVGQAKVRRSFPCGFYLKLKITPRARPSRPAPRRGCRL